MLPLSIRLHISAEMQTSGGIAAIQKISADERIDISVEHLLDISPFHFSTVVFDKLVWLHHIGADLAAKLISGFEASSFRIAARRSRSPARKVAISGPSWQLTILMLAAFVLALNDDAAGKWVIRTADSTF